MPNSDFLRFIISEDGFFIGILHFMLTRNLEVIVNVWFAISIKTHFHTQGHSFQ